MSHSVEPNELDTAAAPYGNTPFLLYSAGDGSARVNHVVAEVAAGRPVVRITGFGRGVPARVADGAKLSLLWPARDAGAFSLIADGLGTVDDDVLTIDVDAAVLHRPAPVDGSTGC